MKKIIYIFAFVLGFVNLNGQAHKKCCDKPTCSAEDIERPVYKFSDRVAGVRNREWHDTQPAVAISASTTAIGRAFRLGHDFTLPTTTNTVITNLNLDDTDNTAGELDIQVLDTYITVPSGGGIWVQYQGGSEGYWAIAVGECCAPLSLQDELGYVDRLDNNAVVGPVFLPEGQHAFRAWNIDSGGTNSSHSVRYSTDGTTFAAALPTGVELNQEKKTIECQKIVGCEDVPEGWDLCYPYVCSPSVVDPVPSLDVSPAASVANIESDNNHSEGSWSRAGNVGTSLLYAREDHQHPIIRIPNPGDITVPITGPATLGSGQVIVRNSEEENYRFGYRANVTTTTANGWVYLTVPNIAGFQRPEIYGLGSYRYSGNYDTGGTGTAVNSSVPQPAWMAQEINHYLFTQRIYFGRPNGKETDARWWVNFYAKYSRASLLFSMLPKVTIISSEKDIEKLKLFDLYLFDDFGLDIAPPSSDKINVSTKDLGEWFEITDKLQAIIEAKFAGQVEKLANKQK